MAENMKARVDGVTPLEPTVTVTLTFFITSGKVKVEGSEDDPGLLFAIVSSAAPALRDAVLLARGRRLIQT